MQALHERVDGADGLVAGGPSERLVDDAEILDVAVGYDICVRFSRLHEVVRTALEPGEVVAAGERIGLHGGLASELVPALAYGHGGGHGDDEDEATDDCPHEVAFGPMLSG